MTPDEDPSDDGPRAKLGLAAMVALGWLVRLRHITAAPFEFHPTRQYYGALIARYYDVVARGEPSAAVRAVAKANCDNLVEPPVLPLLSVLVDRLTGHESMTPARALSALVWCLGAAPLAALARRLGAGPSAWVTVALYLFAPYGILASRAFMPDPWMTALLLTALWALQRDHASPSPSRGRAAAAAWGAVIFVKFVGVIFLPVMWAATARGRRTPRDAPRAAWALAMAPAAAYYAWGYLVAGFLRHASQRRFVPSLLVTSAFWVEWSRRIAAVLGPVAPFVALLALASLPAGPARRALVGAAVAYALFGVAFTYHIHTHDYYSLMLIPFAALAVGVAASRARAVAARALLGALTAVASAWGVARAWRDEDRLARPDVVAQAHEVARVVGPTTRALMAAPWYGLPHMYHGGFHAEFWPDDIARLDEHPTWTASQWLSRAYHGERFDWFVLADRAQLRAQPDLARWLAGARVAHQSPRTVIYDIRGVAP